jgi:uncharacterized protein YndB with AHSA1/START domain
MIRKFLLGSAGVLAVAIAGLLIVASTQPDSFRLERRATIKAPPDKLYAQVEDFRRWTGWSPWENKDPNLKRNYAGASAGKGAVYEWSGDSSVGRGRMEIVDAVPASKLAIRLNFLSPFEAHNMAEFTFTPTAEGTSVTWAMFGPQPFVSKVMTTLWSLDRMVGPEFDTGLANLRKLAER